LLFDYYQTHGRHELPWRIPEPDGSFDPYKIMVSELMLQQTQVTRVIPKFHDFLSRFPTLESLSQDPLSAVLTAWSGLGYNRRAKFLHRAAQQIESEHDGLFPQTESELVALPGVGKNTAGAILAYAFNQPVVFIETNIRTVYIHHFFQDQQGIADADIMPHIAKTLDRTNSRTFYWALMDYGSYLKQNVGNLNKLSKNYTKQSRFEGSLRQVRGQVIRSLTAGPISRTKLHKLITDDRLEIVLQDLLQEGLIECSADDYQLSGSVVQ
jgi:A/G-specific adenine glycosylase